MIKLVISNTSTFLSCEDYREYNFVSKILSVTQSIYLRGDFQSITKKYLTRTESFKGTFPTGLLGRLLPALKAEGFQYKHVSICKMPELLSMAVSYTGFDLFDHQIAAIEKCLRFKRGILKHPTGTGKTVTFSYLISKLGCRALVLVPNKLLLDQTFTKLDSFLSCSVGRCGGKDFEPDADVVVATVAMLHSRIDKIDLQSFGTLIIDECHHINEVAHIWGHEANTWFDLVMRVDAYYRFAFSGTVPESGVQRWALEGATYQLIDDISIRAAIDAGVIAEAKIIMEELPRIDLRTFWPDARQIYIVQRQIRNERIRDVATEYASLGKSVLIFVDMIVHGEMLERIISNSIFVHGISDEEERRIGIQHLTDKSRIVIGTIFGEGFDVPGLDVAINACGGKSVTKILQQLGRVVRKQAQKSEGVLYDFFDRDKDGVLTRHSNQRRRVYTQSVGDVQIIRTK